MENNQELVNRINQALMDDDRLSGHSIRLSAFNGIVTMQGSVQSYRRKLAAHEIAASFEGCRDLINELVVEPPSVVADEEAAGYVRAALSAHADITKEVITVSVSNGRVTLNGHVSNEWERTIAEDVAMSARGVRSVQNLLVVSLVNEIEDQALSLNILEALKWARGLRDAKIQVAVVGDTAVLSGEVQQLWQKETAYSVVRRFRIHKVRNDIQVVGQ